MTEFHGTSRRQFIAASVALASGLAACGKTGRKNMSETTEPLTGLLATEAITAMQRGEISAENYAAALLRQCEQGAYLNAFTALDPARVMEAAIGADKLRSTGASLGPLHGLPIPVKDSVNVQGYPTTGGTQALRNFVPAADASLITRLRDAGAIVLGKTGIHELSWGWTSNNLPFGAVRNPYDPDRIPGGSSGGTAAAVAARMAPIGIAEDTQGSIRVPAAMCGTCGFRPTTGRYPNDGVVPITPLFDQVGPITRSVADIALFDSAVTGEALVTSINPLHGVRLGVPRSYYYRSLDTEVERITAEALRKLSGAGAVLVEVDPPDLERLISVTTDVTQTYHVRPMLTKFLDDYDTGVTFDEVMAQASSDIQESFSTLVLPGGEQTPTEAEFIAARDEHLPALRATMRDYFQDNDLAAMVFPTTRIVAQPIGPEADVVIAGETVDFWSAISRNISPGSTAGLPGLVLPVDIDNRDLPVTIEMDGPAGNDRTLLGRPSR